MDIIGINKRINDEFCNNTSIQLTDDSMMDEYMKCSSVKKEIVLLECILDEYVDAKTKKDIINTYLPKLIPPGTKGVIRGIMFNLIVKKYIIGLELDQDAFEIRFEKRCETHHYTSEIPDWYILEKSTNKIIIGMNQLDLWGGGQQSNRGSKYIVNNEHNNERSKLLCVVCNKIQFKNEKNKTYKLFKIGFENDTLCYLNGLKSIVDKYFTSPSIETQFANLSITTLD